MSKPSMYDAPCVQDHLARLEISVLKERVKIMERLVTDQAEVIERLKRLVGALR